jgi:hypothetical protein
MTYLSSVTFDANALPCLCRRNAHLNSSGTARTTITNITCVHLHHQHDHKHTFAPTPLRTSRTQLRIWLQTPLDQFEQRRVALSQLGHGRRRSELLREISRKVPVKCNASAPWTRSTWRASASARCTARGRHPSSTPTHPMPCVCHRVTTLHQPRPMCAPNIDGKRVRLARDDLGSQEARCAAHRARARLLCELCRQSEPTKLDHTSGADEHARRFDVAMHDVLRVADVQRRRHSVDCRTN